MRLSTYITDVRLLLHDLNGQFWSNAELTSYINKARNRVAQDTKCLRQIISGYALTAGQEQYQISALPVNYATRVIDVMSIDLYWGNARNPLSYMAWTVFSARLRFWQNYLQQPIAFTRMGALSVYFGPVPDQAYLTDWIVAVNPVPLTDDTLDEIPVPFEVPVPYYAAYLAKFKEQAMGEAKIFEGEYRKNLMNIARSFSTRVIPNPQSAGA